VAALTVTKDNNRDAAVVDVSGIPANTATMTLERTSPSGYTVGVRGAVGVNVVGDTTEVFHDWEIPLGVPVHYVAHFYGPQGGDMGSASADFTLPYTDCRAWLVDLARPTNSLQVTIESFTPLDFEVAAGVNRVLERRAPVLVTLPAWTPDAELVVLTDTLLERDMVRALLGSGYAFLLRTTQEQGVGNMYLGVTDFKEDRISTLGAPP